MTSGFRAAGRGRLVRALAGQGYLSAVACVTTGVVEQARQVPVHLDRASAEPIVALQPDLVFVASYTSPDVVRQLEEAGLVVFQFAGFDSIDRLAEHVRQVGRLLGAGEKAAEIVRTMHARLDAVERALTGRQRPRALVYSSFGYTPGAGTSVGDMLERAGAINLAAQLGLGGWQPLSLEQVVALDPEVLVVQEDDPLVAELERNPALRILRAVREGRVIRVPARYLTTVSHFIVDGVEYLAEALARMAGGGP